MSFRTKNSLSFILAFIGFTICFGFLFMNVLVGLPIGLFLSVLMFYDPKKYEAAKKKAAQKELELNNIDVTDSAKNINN